jgi:hypothetical protein
MRGERADFFADWGEHVPPVAVVAPTGPDEAAALTARLQSCGVRDGLTVLIGADGEYQAELHVPDRFGWDAVGRLPCRLRVAGGRADIAIWFWFITWGSVDDPAGYALWWHVPQGPSVRRGACGWWPQGYGFLAVPYTRPDA